MNEEYLRKLYDYLTSNDPTYADDVPFEQFVSQMGENQYAAKIYGYLGDADPTYKQDVSVTDFLGKIRKKKDQPVSVSPSEDGLSEQPKTEIPAFSNLDLKGILENQKVNPRDTREDGYVDPMSTIGMYPDEETLQRARAQQFADLTYTNQQIEAEAPVLAEVKIREEQIKKDQEEALQLERQAVIESPEFESALAYINKEIIKETEEDVVPLMNKLYGKYGFFFRQVGLGDAMEVVSSDGEVLEIDLDPYFDSTASEENIKLKNFIRSKVVKPSEAAEIVESNPVVAAMKAKNLRDKSRLNPDGTESTVMMASAEVDGKFVAYPTLFPTNPDFYGRNPEWWTELDGKEAYEEALKRGEVFYFDTEKESQDFAEGSWKDFTSVDAEADRFFKERGADYIGYKTAYDNYENAMDAIEFIDRAPFKYEDLSDEEKAKYGKYYIDGKRRDNLGQFKQEAEAVADELRPVVNDTDNRTLREDFDVYMNEQFNIKAREAVTTNIIAKEKENELQTESLQYFGLTLEQLSEYTPTNDNEKTKKDILLTGYKDAQAVSQEAANKYEVAETFYNAKFDESVHQQWVEDWAATSNSWDSGYARGKAAEEILKISLGITDLDEDAELDEVSAAIVANLQEGQTGRQGRAEYRWHQARGFQEAFDVLKDDPLELAANFVAGSLSQMFPYGWKIFTIGAGSGAATGAGIGATGFVTGPGGVITTGTGALAGLGYGVKTSMAAISLSMEYTNAVLDAVSNQGLDPMNPNELKEALQDETVWNEGREIGLSRGIPIAIVDFLAAGVAGRVFKVGSVAGRTTRIATYSSPYVTGKTFVVNAAGRTTRIAAGLGERIVFDPLAEATGEYLAQLNAGQEISGKEIFAEAWGGIGNNAPAAAVNMALDARARNNATLANNLANIYFIAEESSSDSKISSWANNMERLGQISSEQNQRIQQNVGLRRDAKNLLEVGEGRVENLVSPANKGVQARTMELLAAKEELSSTTNRREVFRNKIKDINVELAEIAETKTLRPKEQQTILAGTGVLTLPEQSTATDIRQGIKKYLIKGKAYTRQEFLSRIGDMNKKRLLKVRPQVINDDEVQNILNQKLDKDAVPIRETETLALEEQTGVSEEVGAEVREETTKPTTLETERDVEILALPEPVTRPTKEDKAAFENNTLEPERLDGILSAIVDKQLENKKLTPFQQQIAEANKERLQEVVSSKTLEQEATELEEVLALPEAEVTEQKTPAEPVEIAPTEEETQLTSDVETYEMEIEDLQNEIEIEKGNLKEGLDELDAKIKEIRASNRNRATKADLIADLQAQKQDLKDEQNSLIDSYKEDIKALKSDTRKAQRRIKKLEGQRQPKVDFRMRDEAQFVPVADEVREITDVINQQESGNVGTNLDETVDGVTIDAANLNERTTQELPSIATLQIIDGIPTIFTISDQLTIGTAFNPQTGTTIDNLKGGLGFNGTVNNENTAWANTTEKEAADLLKKALQVYEANKLIFEKFWAANPEINGLVPMAVVKMGEGSILSNEATFRVLQDNLTKIPRENKVNAMNALRKSVQEAIDTKQEAINKGNLTKTAKKIYLKDIGNYDTMLQLFESQRVESIDDVVTNEFISFLSLPARRKLIEQITYGQPQRVGAKKKPTKGNKAVPNVLKEGLDKESFTLIHLAPITDVITEPTLENVPQRHIIALAGVDVLNPEIIKNVDHPNYKYGLKGKTIGILENPVSITRAFPQAYQNAVAGLVVEEQKGKVITEKQRERATKEERKAMPEVGELAPSSVESILMQTVGVQIGLPGLEFVGAIAKNNLSDVVKLISFMNVAFPAVNISTDMNTFNNVIEGDGVRVYLKGDEIIYGVTVDGDVYINPDVHNNKSEVFNTAIHEMGHVWTDYLQTSKKGREIYSKGIELVKQDPEYQKQLKRFNGDSQKAANETLAILIGNKGQTIADASLNSKFTEWLLGMWKYIKSQFTQTKYFTEEQIQNLTLDKFIGAALADIFAGKEIKLTDAQLKQLKNPDAAFSMGLSMDAIIERGRANGFSDASIREVLKSRGFNAADINQALEYKVDLFTTMPREFERIEGGILQASKLFNDLRTELNKWATSGRPNIIGEKRVKTFAEIRQKAMDLMKEHPIYKAQNDQVQMEIMSAFDRSLGYRVNPSVQKEISAIRNNLRQRKIGEKNLREAQIRLKNFIRNSLPKSGIYTQAQINRLTKMITETNLDNFEAQALKVMEIVEQQREKIRKERLKEVYNIIKTKAKPAMTKTGKRRAAGLDAIGQETFAAIKPVMDAVLKNDLESLEKLNSFLNDNANEINEALDKYTRGEQLTTKESRLLAQQLAYDSFAELSTASLEEVEQLLTEVKEAKKESILRFKTRRLERAARAKAVADLVTEQIKETNSALFDENGKVLDANERNDVADDIRASLQKFKLKEAYQKIRSSFFKTKAGEQITAFKNWFRHLGTLTNLLDRVTDGKTMFTDYIYRRLNRADEMYNVGLFEIQAKLDNIAKQAGIDGGRRGVDMLLHGIGIQQLQVIRSKTGRERLTYLNGDQLLRIYALSKNSIQAKKLANQGITEDVIADIATILGPELTTYADGVVNFLSNEYYESINQVYATVNNVNLGFVENYFPTRTLQGKVNSKLLNDGDFNGIFNAETSPAFKERLDQKSDIELKAGDFTSVLQDHIQTMEKYKAFAETSQQLNDFFRVEAVDALLEVTGLKKAVKGAINFAINPMAGKNGDGIEPSIMEKLQNKFTSFALGFKLVQIPKQASSFINAYEEYSYFPPNSRVPRVIQSPIDLVMFMVDGARVLGSMALDLVGKDGAIHQAMEMSATFRKRIEQGLEGDVYGLESGSQTFKPLDKSMSKVARARRALRTGASAPTVIGDVMGVMGYMINYKRNIANGMSKAEALEAFNNYNATQQSRRGTDKIPLQYSNNALVRGFTMFGSTLFLQINKVMSSATNMSRSISEGNMPRKQDIRAFYLNLSIANVLFVGVSNIMMFIKGDDEDREAALDKMRDAMLGLNLLYQIPYAGAMFESLDPGERLEALVTGKEYKKKRKMVDDVVNPFTSVSFKVNRLMKEEGWTGVIRPIAELVMGVQLDPFIGMFNKAMKPEDLLEFDENMYDILGISKSYRPEVDKKGKYEGIMPVGGIKTKSDLKRYSPELYEMKYSAQDRVRKEQREHRADILKSMGYKETDGKLYPID